jgi:hypothetical protein
MRIITHQQPIWRERANFLIVARIEISAFGLPDAWEQLWSRQLGDQTFEICCIPLLARDLALGDEVETSTHDGRQYVIDHVSKGSGHYTFQIWFRDEATRQGLPNQLEALGCPYEWAWDESNLLAVDATCLGVAEEVARLLHHAEDRGQLEYQTGRTK